MRATRSIPYGVVFVALVVMLLLPSGAWADVFIHQPYVKLTWAAHPGPDVGGYEIFRSNFLDRGFVKAHDGVLATTSWTDETVENDLTYYYKVRAVDLCGNPSALSDPSDAVVIQLTQEDTLVAPSSEPDDAL